MRRVKGRTRQPIRTGGLVLAAALGFATSALAASPRFAAVLPGGVAGEYEVAVAAKSAAGLELAVDGQPIAAALAPAGPGRFTAHLSGVPAAAGRLELRKKGEALAAVALAPLAGEAATFARWTIYHVMVEMFADGDGSNDSVLQGWRHPRYAGGDLAGVLAKVDYLRDLGVDAVWLSPIFAAQTSHGYDVESYYRIGDAVGVAGRPDESLALFRHLRAALAERGIRTILDLPLNHASKRYQKKDGDPLGLDPRATSARQEAEKLWESWGAGYRYWDFDHAPTREFLRQVAIHWLRDEAVDGLRLDYVRGVPHDFWAELFAAVKLAKPGAFLVGECWLDQGSPAANAQDIATYYAPVGGGRQFDSLLDFPLQAVLTDVFARGGSADELEATLQESAALYGAGALPTYFLDNHDLARFLDRGGDRDRLVAALTFMAALSGPNVLFYGTETGLAGGQSKPGFTDSGRLPMPWKSLDVDLERRAAAILAARRAHPALATGARLPLLADDQTLVMAKVGAAETLLVGVNLGRAPRVVDLDTAGLFPSRGAVTTVLGGASATAAIDASGHVRWTLPSASTVVLAGTR